MVQHAQQRVDVTMQVMLIIIVIFLIGVILIIRVIILQVRCCFSSLICSVSPCPSKSKLFCPLALKILCTLKVMHLRYVALSKDLLVTARAVACSEEWKPWIQVPLTNFLIKI